MSGATDIFSPEPSVELMRQELTVIPEKSTYEILKVFTALVFDWEASIRIVKAGLNIPEGSYDLSRMGDKVHACSQEKAYFLPDRPVTVEVVSAPEE
ncbi:MAG: hypothetical protein H6557_09500 [Lewinellaceae bacterium]|nr:hypothetical protein [candidate division KSB1 bacterium]MCB9036840.1 hypothetical protein [Lewinellaceae bacterium]